MYTYKTLHIMAPSYLKFIINVSEAVRTNRPIKINLPLVPKIVLNIYNKRTFKMSATILWSSITDLKQRKDITVPVVFIDMIYFLSFKYSVSYISMTNQRE